MFYKRIRMMGVVVLIVIMTTQISFREKKFISSAYLKVL